MIDFVTILFCRYKKLLALLFYLLDRGQRLDCRSFERDHCCRAASLYFVLLSIPGSGAFSIFHPVLFNRTLDTFKMATKLRLAKFSPRKKKRGGGRRGGAASQRARTRHSSRAGSTCSGAMVSAIIVYYVVNNVKNIYELCLSGHLNPSCLLRQSGYVCRTIPVTRATPTSTPALWGQPRSNA